MFELKSKNSQDQIGRLEEKEADMKKEYTKLHERHVKKKYFRHLDFFKFCAENRFFRYTDLFKTHMDYMERSKVSQNKGAPFCYLAKLKFVCESKWFLFRSLNCENLLNWCWRVSFPDVVGSGRLKDYRPDTNPQIKKEPFSEWNVHKLRFAICWWRHGKGKLIENSLFRR